MAVLPLHCKMKGRLEGSSLVQGEFRGKRERMRQKERQRKAERHTEKDKGTKRDRHREKIG